MNKNLNSLFYTSVFYGRLVNKLMRHGKKGKIEALLLRVFLQISRYSKIPVFFIFFEILEKQRCFISFKKIIQKKRTKLVPRALSVLQQYWFSISLLAKTVKLSPFKASFIDTVHLIFLAYFNSNKRSSIWGMQEKERLYTLAVENRYLLHYRW